MNLISYIIAGAIVGLIGSFIVAGFLKLMSWAAENYGDFWGYAVFAMGIGIFIGLCAHNSENVK